jgi:hypothetical protein
MARWSTGLSNKELKLTKPSIMELRSLTPVFDGQPGRAAMHLPDICSALVAASVLVAEPQAPLSFAFRLTGVQPDCSADGVGYPVSIIIHTTVTNLSDRPLILSRELSSAPYYRVAASVERGALGDYEVEFAGHEVVSGDTPQPTFGSEPDPARFVLLHPGSTYDTDVTTGVLAGNREALAKLGQSGGFVLPGAHAIQTSIRTWPHIFVEAGTTERLRRQWQRFGDLVTADVQTPFLPFELPKSMARCDAH